jgi:multisubunit Na+/H+ antiporter MnhF subunit
MFEALIIGGGVWVLGLLGAVAWALRRAGAARRLVLADTAVQLLVILLVLTAIQRQEAYFLDAALALALLSFVSSIVVGAHSMRRREQR